MGMGVKEEEAGKLNKPTVEEIRGHGSFNENK